MSEAINQVFTVEEVKKHGAKNSPWIIIHNSVYDVSGFLDEHPGGADALLDVAGGDGTQAFEDVGHSADARELLKKYKIGSVPGGDSTKIFETCKLKWALLALAGALVIGVVLRRYMT